MSDTDELESKVATTTAKGHKQGPGVQSNLSMAWDGPLSRIPLSKW